jgi:hypothetical protein
LRQNIESVIVFGKYIIAHSIGAFPQCQNRQPSISATSSRPCEADLVDLKWGEKGILCGNPLPANPTVLTLIVADEADACIINRAKEAISQGDEEAAAYTILAEITQEQATQH